MANMNFGVNILPKANNTYTLGNSDYKWNIFANTLNGISLTNIITDIQIDGTSILSNNVANIPIGAWDVLGVVKPNPDYGVGRIASDNPISNGTLLVAKATSAQIKTGNNEYKPIVPYNQHESVFYGLAKAAGDSTQSASSNAVGTYTANAKSAIQTMLEIPKDIQINNTSIINNGIANIPIAAKNILGAVMINGYGLWISSENGLLATNRATLEHIKAGTQEYRPIVPCNQHEAVFYGLAKAAGDSTQSASSNAVGLYTDSAKTAIKNMLAVPKIDDNEDYDLNTTWSAKRLSATTRIHSWIASNFSNGLELPTPTIIADQKIDEQGNLVSDSNYNTYVYTLTLNTTLIIYTRNNEEFTYGQYSSSSISSSNLYSDITTINSYDYIQIMAPYFAFSCEKTTVNNNNVIILYMGFTGVTNTDYATAEKAGVIKIDGNGLWINSSNGKVSITKASTANIKSGTVETYPIVPYNQHEAVFYGLAKAAGDSTQASSSNAVGTYTSSAKSAIRNMLAVAPKSSPFFTGAISLGRYHNSADESDEANTIGFYSIAVGNNVAASGEASQAFGQDTYAVGWTAHAEGRDTAAYGNTSHTEGVYTLTEDGAWASHAEGSDTIANTPCVHVGGQYNSITDLSLAPTWTANTSYAVGDIVKHEETEDDETYAYVYRCITANNDTTFDYEKWITWQDVGDFAEIIGNGGYINDDEWTELRSNARALDWQGNEYLNGTLYVNCNNDSTGGTQVATTADLQNKVDLISNIVRGNPCAFDSPAEDLPLKSVELHFSYTQSGSGDPYPPGGGKNLYDQDTYPLTQGGWIGGEGGYVSTSESYAYTGFIPCEHLAGQEITLNKRPGGGYPGFTFYSEENDSKPWIESIGNNSGQAGTPWTITVPSTAKYMRFTVPANTFDIQIELGSSSTTYAPYSNIRPISGISNLFCTHTKKNMAQIRGYSAENKPYTAEGALSNSYGTTISTTSPESSLVITQSSSTTDYAKNHYRNGYVVFRTDNMVIGQYYDVSIKVTNITSNPLETALSELCLTSPSGGITTPTEIIGNVLIWKNMLYRDTNGIQSWEVRICGISCTFSEFMVTPANTNDGVYEPYNGAKLDVVFPALGKNLCPPPVKGIGVQGYNGEEYTDTSKATTDYIPVDFTTNPNYRFSGMPSSLTMWVSGYNANKEFVGRTASDKRVAYTITSSKFTEGSHAYTGDIAFVRLTFSAGSGASIDDVDSASIQLEIGDTTTAYEPYCDTVYNGSLDLVSGVLTLTHAEYETTWGAGNNLFVLTANEGRRITLPFTCVDATWDATGACNVTSWRWSYESDTTHFYNHQSYSYVFLPVGTDDNTKIQIIGKLAEPVTVQLTPEQIKTFKGLNTIQSDVNGTIIIDSYMDLQGYKDSSLQDIQINGSSIISNNIATIPAATSSTLGLVKLANGGGLAFESGGSLKTAPASDSQIKAGTESNRPIVPSNEYMAAFYGLAKAAGDTTQSASSNTVGNYTDSARIAIQKMIFGYAIGPMEKIAEYTVAENSTSVSISTDLNGNEFKLAHAQVVFKIGTPTTNTKDYIRAYVLFKNSKSQLEKWGAPTLSLTSAGNTNCWMIYTFYSINGLAHVMGKSTNTGNTQPVQQATYQGGILPYISGFYVEQYSASTTLIPAGAQIIIYGCRYYD